MDGILVQPETGKTISVEPGSDNQQGTPVSIGSNGFKDVYLLNQSVSQGTVKLYKQGQALITLALAGQAIIQISNTPASSITSDVSLTGSVLIKNDPDGPLNSVRYVPLQLSTSGIQNIYTSSPVTAATSGLLNLFLIGQGSVASITVGSITYTLNNNIALTSGALYAFTIAVIAGSSYTITGATFVEGVGA
jgi:hypothetical protein